MQHADMVKTLVKKPEEIAKTDETLEANMAKLTKHYTDSAAQTRADKVA
jgi:prefoldin subunit 5